MLKIIIKFLLLFCKEGFQPVSQPDRFLAGLLASQPESLPKGCQGNIAYYLNTTHNNLKNNGKLGERLRHTPYTITK